MKHPVTGKVSISPFGVTAHLINNNLGPPVAIWAALFISIRSSLIREKKMPAIPNTIQVIRQLREENEALKSQLEHSLEREENTKLIEENEALKLHIKKLNDTFKVYREHHADTIRALKRQISHYESSLAQLSLLADTYRKSK